jgi:hypothetical protein
MTIRYASSLLDLCKRYRQTELAIRASMYTAIITMKSGTLSTIINRQITSIIPRPACTNWIIPLNYAADFFPVTVDPVAQRLRPSIRASIEHH